MVGMPTIFLFTLDATQKKMHIITPPWPFETWGMDVLDPFLFSKEQVKFLIVAIYYFIKWIEMKPLTTISSQ